VPKSILNSKDKVFYARFLRGLFDTDGCLSFQKKNYSKFRLKKNFYPVISIATVSERLIEDIKEMLNYLQIKHFSHGYQPNTKRKDYPYKDNYRHAIYVNGIERLKKWMEVIGTRNPSKLSRYLIWQKFGFCPANLTYQQRKSILKGELDINSLGL